jgi:hypothetical protein
MIPLGPRIYYPVEVAHLRREAFFSGLVVGALCVGAWVVILMAGR